MKRLHIIGGKNHGKTTLVVELVEEFTRRGMTVGTIKHTHHQHELDVLARILIDIGKVRTLEIQVDDLRLIDVSRGRQSV